MTAKEPSVTGVPDGVREAVERHYDLGAVDVVERLPSGVSNDVFGVRARGRSLVLRVQQIRSGIESVEWEHALVSALAGVVPEVPAPIRTRDGGTFVPHDGLALSLLPFANALPARVGDPAERLEAARVLARLHGASAELEPPPRPGHARLADLPFPEVGALSPELARHASRLEELRADAIAVVRRLAEQRLTTGVVHGDYFPGNLLVADRRAVAVLDWEEADVDWQAYDVACAAWSFTVAEMSDQLDRGAMDDFVARYRDAGGTVPPSEDDVLVPLVRVKRILEILRAPTDRRVDWEYQLRNFRAAEKLS